MTISAGPSIALGLRLPVVLSEPQGALREGNLDPGVVEARFNRCRSSRDTDHCSSGWVVTTVRMATESASKRSTPLDPAIQRLFVEQPLDRTAPVTRHLVLTDPADQAPNSSAGETLEHPGAEEDKQDGDRAGDQYIGRPGQFRTAHGRVHKLTEPASLFRRAARPQRIGSLREECRRSHVIALSLEAGRADSPRPPAEKNPIAVPGDRPAETAMRDLLPG